MYRVSSDVECGLKTESPEGLELLLHYSSTSTYFWKMYALPDRSKQKSEMSSLTICSKPADDSKAQVPPGKMDVQGRILNLPGIINNQNASTSKTLLNTVGTQCQCPCKAAHVF